MIYTGQALKEIIFPLGGIGTGSIGLAGDGRLCDWEIFNRPNKGSYNGYSHICVVAQTQGKRYVKILNGDLAKELMGRYSKRTFGGYGYGPDGFTMCGFPHFKETLFRGEFPFATLTFTDENFPGAVELTAFNPFIPHNADDSGIPAAFFSVKFINTTPHAVRYSAVFSVNNPFEKSKNEIISDAKIKGVKLLNAAVPDTGAIGYGDLTVATDCKTAGVQEYWYRGIWKDAVVTFYNEVSAGDLPSRHYEEAGKDDHCSVYGNVSCGAGETAAVRFVLAWNCPNNYNYWSPYKDENGKDVTWKNYYAVRFADSNDSAHYSLREWERLYALSDRFRTEMYAATLDPCIIDAAASNLCVLKSPTVLRLEGGEFYGWEGVHEQEGSCEGSCQHVWNYAYALCFLFPDLERSMREVEVKYALDEYGGTQFRVKLPLGRPEENAFRSCLDGQMGTVIKIYREWKLGGGDGWLKAMWPSVKKMLSYAWSEKNPDGWDSDKDGVLEGRQHHTLDMELFGPSAWLEGFYLAALRAGALMAEYLGDEEASKEYNILFAKGYAWSKNNLFNGEYFYQKADLGDRRVLDAFGCAGIYWNEEKGQIKYQIGEGCEIDQLCGQWHADICGLGDIFDEAQRKRALQNMYKYNFKPSVREFVNPWRVFALNDESASIICAYPEGTKKPAIPVPYCEESMNGFEYQFAGELFAAGMEREGLAVVRAVRGRYAGHNRNPYNEFECGSNYARSMASFALLPILSGFVFDLPHKKIGFYPRTAQTPFRCIWSAGAAWGNVIIGEECAEVNVCGGALVLSVLGLYRAADAKEVMIDGERVKFTATGEEIAFCEREIAKGIKVLF